MNEGQILPPGPAGQGDRDTHGAAAEGLRIVRDAPLVGLALAMMERGDRVDLRRDGGALEYFMCNLLAFLRPAPALCPPSCLTMDRSYT